MVARAARLGEQLDAGCCDLQDRYDVSATFAAADCCKVSSSCRQASKAPADGSARRHRACLERGLHMNIVQLPGMGGIFRIAPPLTISEDDLHAGLDILEASLKAVLDGRG